MAWADEVRAMDSALFTRLGQAATYIPAAGGRFAVTAVPTEQELRTPLLDNYHIEQRQSWDLRYADLATGGVSRPVAGDCLLVGDDIFTIDEIDLDDGFVVSVLVR